METHPPSLGSISFFNSITYFEMLINREVSMVGPRCNNTFKIGDKDE